MSRRIPETEAEWAALDYRRMHGDRLPFKYVILLCAAAFAIMKLWVIPAWDRQMNDLYNQQNALEAACVKAGGIVTEDGCRGLRKAGK